MATKNPTTTTPTFLASTRTKALEETPIPPKRASKGEKKDEGESGGAQSSMEDLLCLNYGGGQKTKTNRRMASPPSNTDLSEYLSPSPGGKPGTGFNGKQFGWSSQANSQAFLVKELSVLKQPHCWHWGHLRPNLKPKLGPKLESSL